MFASGSAESCRPICGAAPSVHPFEVDAEFALPRRVGTATKRDARLGLRANKLYAGLLESVL